jgi:hypothetical protein
MASKSSRTPAEQIADAELELRIRERAYQLWEADGAPEGKSEEYWHRARKLIEDEAKSGTSPDPMRADEPRPNPSPA